MNNMNTVWDVLQRLMMVEPEESDTNDIDMKEVDGIWVKASDI